MAAGFALNPDRAQAATARVVQRKPSNPVPFRAAGKLSVAIEYMLAHLDQPISIARLSAMAGYSPSSFFDLFKRTTGAAPLNWFIRARMKWAGELLGKSNLRIKEIAGQVGYKDQFYFSRLFKYVHGMAPRRYRAQKQQESTRIDSAKALASRGKALAIDNVIGLPVNDGYCLAIARNRELDGKTTEQ